MRDSSLNRLDLTQIINQIQKTNVESAKEPARMFPYIETYGRSFECDKNLIMNKTIKIREKYTHHNTLRYKDPSFSYQLTLDKIKKDIFKNQKIKPKPKVRIGRPDLREKINRTELGRNTEEKDYSKFFKKLKLPNGNTVKDKFLSESYGGISPAYLHVSNYDAFSKKDCLADNLNYYKETFRKADSRFSSHPKPQVLSNRESPKQMCDANINTDLIV